MVPRASDRRACLALGSSPFFIRPACFVTPIRVPTVSNKAKKKKTKITSMYFKLKAPIISNFRKVGEMEGGREKIPSYLANPKIKETTVEDKIPNNIKPLIFKVINIMVMATPKRVINTIGLWRSPRPIIVPGFPTTIPPHSSPTSAMSSPIPTAIPCFKDS
ncbi:MAG: hypothetical protein ABIL20_05295, partial [candidate division WOR-3 bacterium]